MSFKDKRLNKDLNNAWNSFKKRKPKKYTKKMKISMKIRKMSDELYTGYRQAVEGLNT